MRFSIISCLLLLQALSIHSFAAGQTSNANGYDYMALKKNKPFTRQVNKEHTIYEIKYDYDLQGQTVIIPTNCILKFSGGSLKNGNINFNNTIIDSHYGNIFKQITINGSIANNEVWLSWWELAYSSEVNDAPLINQVVKAIDNCILYYDIQGNVYTGGEKSGNLAGEIVSFENKHNLKVVQPTKFFTILKGRSKGGHVISCANNKYITIDGMKIDGANVYYSLYGENGIGVTGNEKVHIENCVIRNCTSNCFDKAANGTLVNGGYPEWGAGGKGIQIEGSKVATQVTVRSNYIQGCYIGISNNASDQENVFMDGNYIDSCYMSIILMRLGGDSRRMCVNMSNTIIVNNTGDVGVICMGNAENINMINTQVRGERKVKSVLRGCFSNSIIQMIVDQHCENLIDAALYRDNPEGYEAANNYVKIVANKNCDYIINTSSSVVPKKGGKTHVLYKGGEYDISVQGDVNKTPVVLPTPNKTTLFKLRIGESYKSGNFETINR